MKNDIVDTKILFIDTYYPRALEKISSVLDGTRSYSDLIEDVIEFGFGTGGAYVKSFRDIGVSAELVIPNSHLLQTAWWKSRKHYKIFLNYWNSFQIASRIPFLRSFLAILPSPHKILLSQILEFRPDVVVVQDLHCVPPRLARTIRKHVKILIGEIASPLPPKQYICAYNIIISALPSIVEKCADLGVTSFYVPLAFDKKYLSNSPMASREIDVVFIGQISRLQKNTAPLLQEVARINPTLNIYSPKNEKLFRSLGLTENYHGEAWGLEMFKILSNSKIVINRHGEIAGDFAVNMRMYEATGSGCALVTEDRSNLNSIFPGTNEVVTYRSIKEAAEKIKELLESPSDLEEVARRGQERTLKEHTYEQRVHLLNDILQEYMQR